MAQALLTATRRCLERFLHTGSPDLLQEVIELLQSIKMTPRQVQYILRTFKELKQHDPLTISTGPNECSTESLIFLIRTRRVHVARILQALMHLAGYSTTVTWNGFLFALLNFCALSKIELCQVLFLMIAQSTKSWTIVYVTASQLEDFYREYNTCPEPSFNTSCVNFARLPLAKYTVEDFIELVYRFGQLINPCLHLQRQLQAALPSLRFWSNYDNIKVQNRKIPVDFFRCPKVQTIAEAALAHTMAVPDDVDNLRNSAIVEEEEQEVALVDIASKLKARHEQQPPRKWPHWLEQYVQQNEDPKRGTALGSKASVETVGAERPCIVNDADAPKSVEDAKARIRATMVAPTRSSEHAEEEDPGAQLLLQKVERWRRNQELEFVRKSRATLDKRDDMVSIIERHVACGLITRPTKKVQGHL